MSKQKLIIILILLFSAIISRSQMVINGNMNITNGALVHVDQSIINQNMLVNDGHIVVGQNFMNHAHTQSGTASRLEFTGSELSTFLPGEQDYSIVELNKNHNDVALKNDASIDSILEFSGQHTRLLLDTSSVIIGRGGECTGFSETNYIVADRSGYVVKKVHMDSSSWHFPVGDSSHYSPIYCNLTGSTLTDFSELKIRISDTVHPNVTGASSLSRYWKVEQRFVENYRNQSTGYYLPEDIVGVVSEIVGASHSNLWHYENSSGNIDNRSVTSTIRDSISDFTGHSNIGTIAGNVTIDINNDNIGEENLAGVMINLFQGDGITPAENVDGTLISAAATSTDGSYLFSKLLPGEYVIKQTQPSGYVSVSDKDNSNDGDSHDTDETVDNTINVTLLSGEDDLNNDFIEKLIDIILSGTIYYDNNSLRDSLVYGSTLVPNGIYAVLVKISASNIEEVTQIVQVPKYGEENVGKFTFDGKSLNSYYVFITTSTELVGQPPSGIRTLPPSYRNTGEFIKDPAIGSLHHGSDGNVNGVSSVFTTLENNIPFIDFGVRKFISITID